MATYVELGGHSKENEDTPYESDPYLIPWLHTAISYNLMWSLKSYKNGKLINRKLYINIIGMSLTICSTIYLIWSDFSVIRFGVYTTSQMQELMYTLRLIFIFISRIMLIFYFSKLIKHTQTNINFTNDEIINKTNKRMKIMLIVFIVSYIIHESFYWYQDIQKVSSAIDWMDTICWAIAIYLPLIIAHLYCSEILLKNQLLLSKIMNKLSHQKQDDIFSVVRNEYKLLSSAFAKEFNFWRFYIGLLLVNYFFFLWIYTSTLIHGGLDHMDFIHVISGIILWALPLVEFVLASSSLLDEYKLFSERVMNYYADQMKLILNDDDAKDTNISLKEINIKLHKFKDHQILYNFIQKHPFCVTLGSRTVSTSNAVQLIVFFAVTKTISYSIYHLQ